MWRVDSAALAAGAAGGADPMTCGLVPSVWRLLALAGLVALWSWLLWVQFIRERDHERNNYAGLVSVVLLNVLLVALVWMTARGFYCDG